MRLVEEEESAWCFLVAGGCNFVNKSDSSIKLLHGAFLGDGQLLMGCGASQFIRICFFVRAANS
jgi:hypothetical protein